jgi:hypothetical protein
MGKHRVDTGCHRAHRGSAGLSLCTGLAASYWVGERRLPSALNPLPITAVAVYNSLGIKANLLDVEGHSLSIELGPDAMVVQRVDRLRGTLVVKYDAHTSKLGAHDTLDITPTVVYVGRDVPR